MAQEATTPVHCYTNPSFCRQSEYIPDASYDRHANELPPPPQQFQGNDDLPPPPPPLQLQCHAGGQSNPAFQEATLQANDRYCYLEDNRAPAHRRYASLPVEEPRVTYCQSSRYEYLEQDSEAESSQLARRGSSRYEFIPHQQVQQQRSAPATNQDVRAGAPAAPRTYRGNAGRYALIPGEQEYQDDAPQWSNAKSPPRHINTPQGRYARVPLQEDMPPALPDRNGHEFSVSPKNNLATQKLHEILSTPRKPRSRSEERTLSPRKQQSFDQTSTPQRRALTPNGSPNGRTFSPTRPTPQGTPQSRTFPPMGPQTSTPNKEPSARRCLPLENSARQQDICPANNCGRLRYVGTAPVDLMNLSHGEPPPRYAYAESGELESMPMMPGSPRYQMVPADRKNYQSVESAFMARTAVVPPLSPPNSEMNTTLASGLEKGDRKCAPILLILVGSLTCGLAIYLSCTQGRRYYFDSAISCGVCCFLAGACRSLRRIWTGLGLAGLSALSCAGLLLLVNFPKDGTPLHDITAGALCGVSVLGAVLALLALLKPRCTFGRHRRVHSWIPRFSP